MIQDDALSLPDLPVLCRDGAWFLAANTHSVPVDDPVLSGDLTRLAQLLSPVGESAVAR